MFVQAPRTLLGIGQRLPRVVPLARVPLLQRKLSTNAISTYSSLPATLHYYRLRQTSRLFDNKQKDSHPDDFATEGLYVAEDGLVYPKFESVEPNGALLCKNTFYTHLCFRMYYEQRYLDPQEEGNQVDSPYILTIPKGTQLPNHFILSRCHDECFCLQPSHGMTLDDLNRSLDEFYSEHALEEDAWDFLKKYPNWRTMTFEDDEDEAVQ